MNKEEIKISSKLSKDFSTKINLGGETYLIDSEDLGIQNPNIRTKVYIKGKIIYSHKINYKDILNEPDFDKKLTDLLQSQQQIAIEAVKKEKTIQERNHTNDIKEGEDTDKQKRTYKYYIKEIEALIRINSHEEALELLTEAMEHYPHNPIVLSYHGRLEALVNKQYSEGIRICRQSFKNLKQQMPLVEGFFLPILYLNLGKTYLTANKKKEAYFSFQKGLEIDKKDEDLLFELNKIGRRRKPPFTFLKRSNPLNKYIGMFTYELQKMTMRT
jgi:tetratricopeptide (TPR) repeat protein